MKDAQVSFPSEAPWQGVEGMESGNYQGSNPALLLLSSATLGKLLNLSGPVSHLLNGAMKVLALCNRWGS